MKHVFWLFGFLVALGTGCSRTTKEMGPTVDPNDQAELVKSNNRFAIDLYAQASKEPGNLFLSPYSVSTALAMTYAGARGTTAEQMAKTLRFPLDPKRLHPTFAALRKALQGKEGKGYELESANALWVQQGFDLQADFVAIARQYYDANAAEVDFSGDAQAARESINDWVAKQTNEKIRGLLQPGDLTPLTRLVLTNAIYLKGDWAAQFAKTDTHDQRFYRKNVDFVTVPLMAQCAVFPFCQDGTLQVAEFPYVGKHLSMVVVLPQSAEGLPVVEKTLTADKIAEWIGRLEETKINVYLPRFRAKFRLDLKERLSALGMPLAFDPDQANFTGMIGADPQKNLHISKVIHEAFVEISEEGAEAAGSTAVILVKKSVEGGPREIVPPTFRADHPFLFLIRDTRSGSILFIGRLTDPSK